jgi:hypothetical protein
MSESQRKLAYNHDLQQLVIEAVYAHWNEFHQPAGLKTIRALVIRKIVRKQFENTWPWQWESPDPGTIDRRTNECASLNSQENFHLTDRGPRIIRTSLGFYAPNSAMFEQAVQEATMR